MKRALLISAGLIGGTGAVLAITPPQFGTSPTAGLASSPAKTATPTTSTKATTKPGSGTVGVSGTFSGATANTQFGPVQVQIVVQNGKITNAIALQAPSSGGRTQQINAQAIPYLIQETLKAQSANIQGVGGASYTSNGWAQSLQSAITKAGI
ncbi:MAG: FMN-binding protein [Actinomycetes bacterium]|jgi:uncharacterized protein with FMN-binding domain